MAANLDVKIGFRVTSEARTLPDGCVVVDVFVTLGKMRPALVGTVEGHTKEEVDRYIADAIKNRTIKGQDR